MRWRYNRSWWWNVHTPCVSVVCQTVKVLWCKLAHRKDHICWDDLYRDTWGPSELPWPGNKSWVCNKCMRAWYIPNSYKDPWDRPAEETQWDSWIYNFPAVVEKKEKEDA